MNNSVNDVLNRTQQSVPRRIYTTDNTLAFMDVGKVRNNQEDSLLFVKHPTIGNAELLLVADGVGGVANGELASNMVAQKVLEWFIKYDFFRKDMDYLVKSYSEHLNYIDDLLRSSIPDGCSTLVSAILHDDKTLVTNVGDSRCYIYDGVILEQITEDHNYAWDCYKRGLISKDDLRFCAGSNLLASKIGGRNKVLKADSFVIDTALYNKLFLCSDGVSDVLSSEAIKYGIINYDNPEAFLDYILNYNEKRENNNALLIKDEVFGGTDNTSAIVRKIKR